jgi:hypothetical protein
MATVESPFAPTLGEHGEPCAGCGSPLASDQRYCLNCGRRRANARLPFDEVLAYAADGTAGGHAGGGNGAGAAAATAPVPPRPERGLTPLAVVLALSAVVVALGLGVVLGRGGNNSSSPAKPQVITVGGAAASPASTGAGDAGAAFTSDWPEGQEGYTVQLQVLPKDSTQPDAVAAAKTDAEGKGAANVGALDSDSFASLPAGNYVVYAGVFKGKAAAAKALKKLKKDFPDAKVVRVSTTAGAAASTGAADPNALNGKKKEATVGRDQLKQLQNLSPSEYQKKSQKLPDTTAIEGTPPPKDNKAPGGGSGGATVIG